jgi:uncharacterized protein (DUF1778 family)
MITGEKIKNERINLRLNSSAKSILERAAGLEGKTVSNFILNCAIEKAEQTVRKHEAITLNAKNSKAFLEALSTPAGFNKNLSDALKEHEDRVVSK